MKAPGFGPPPCHVPTAGYMSRRLMKALEDLYVHYDLTVRNAAGGIVQLAYGEDGMDPVAMEGTNGQPLDFDRLLSRVRHVCKGGRKSERAKLRYDMRESSIGDVSTYTTGSVRVRLSAASMPRWGPQRPIKSSYLRHACICACVHVHRCVPRRPAPLSCPVAGRRCPCPLPYVRL